MVKQNQFTDNAAIRALSRALTEFDLIIEHDLEGEETYAVSCDVVEAATALLDAIRPIGRASWQVEDETAWWDAHPEYKTQFVNYYRCANDCGEWEDTWDCACNDRCPKCNTETEPYLTEDAE